MALLNNTRAELTAEIEKQKLTKTAAALKADYTLQYLAKILISKVVNDSFIKIWDALGYDIHIEYIPKQS